MAQQMYYDIESFKVRKSDLTFLFEALENHGFQKLDTPHKSYCLTNIVTHDMVISNNREHKVQQLSRLKETSAMKLPITIFDIGMLTDENFDTGWFLKFAPEAGGRCVFYVKSLSDAHKEYQIRRLEFPDKIYLLSKHIPNPWCWNGCKTDLRIYVYITSDNHVWIQKHACIRKSIHLWDLTAKDGQLTNTTQGSAIFTTHEWPWIKPWFDVRDNFIIPLVRDYWIQSCHIYQPPALISMDVMLSDMSAYFIEANSCGNIRQSKSEAVNDLKKTVCRDIVTLEVLPTMKRTERDPGNFLFIME